MNKRILLYKRKGGEAFEEYVEALKSYIMK